MEPKKAPYTCGVCKALFSLRKPFFEHVQTCLENEKANKNANKQEDPLEIHEEKVRTTSVKKKQFVCKICNKKFGQRDNLISHAKNKHSGNFREFKRKDHEQKQVNKNVESNGIFVPKAKIDTETENEKGAKNVRKVPKSRQNVCGICKSSFTAPSVLLNHIVTVHLLVKPTNKVPKVWLDRLNEEKCYENKGRKKSKFSLDFKLKGIEEAKRTSNIEFGRKYGIDRTVINRWRQNEEKLRQAMAEGGRFRVKGGGLKRDDLLDQLLYEWYAQQIISNNARITGTMLRVKAHELAQSCATGSEGSKFSNGWLEGFKKKYEIRIPQHKWTLKEDGEANNKLVEKIDDSRNMTVEHPYIDNLDVTQFLAQDMTQESESKLETKEENRARTLRKKNPLIITNKTKNQEQDMIHNNEMQLETKEETNAKPPVRKTKSKNHERKDLHLEVVDEHDNNLADPDKETDDETDTDTDPETDNEMEVATNVNVDKVTDTEIITKPEANKEHKINSETGFGLHFLTEMENEMSNPKETNAEQRNQSEVPSYEKNKQQKLFNCSYCDKSYTAHHHWKIHEKMHTEGLPYSCKNCDFTSRTRQSLKIHELAKHDNREKQFSCRFCPKLFLKFKSVKPHEKTHSGIRPYPCSYCEKRFTQLHRVKEHERIHTGEKPFSCKSCDYKSRAASTLRIHKILKHSGDKESLQTDEKSFICSVNGCKEKFIDSNQAKVHEKEHDVERPFPCKICGKLFKSPRDLKSHQIVHTGEKPYSCKYCDKKFAWIQTCGNHERIHTGEKPYSCNICDYKARTLQSMSSHNKVHTGERPYPCKKCDYRSKTQSSLKRHENRCNGNNHVIGKIHFINIKQENEIEQSNGTEIIKVKTRRAKNAITKTPVPLKFFNSKMPNAKTSYAKTLSAKIAKPKKPVAKTSNAKISNAKSLSTRNNNAMSSIDTTMRSDQMKPKKLAAKSSHAKISRAKIISAKNFNENSSIDMTIEAVIQSAMTPDQTNKQKYNINKNKTRNLKGKSKNVQVKTEKIQTDMDSSIKKENVFDME